MALFEINNLSFSYPAGGRILDGVNLKIERGDFLILCGPTGSGKTTLLRLVKPELSPKGERGGEILYDGKNIDSLTPSESVKIGFVCQSAEHQTVTDKVWHEIAFGMENLKFTQSEMSRRIAEISGYFGIDSLFDKNISELSGGQKQTVALASVLAMNPDVIIFDEPTSQLDPVAAGEFLASLKKINDEQGITIIITEHRLENVIPLANKIAVLGGGKITLCGDTREAVKNIGRRDFLFDSLPGSAKLFNILCGEGECPLTVREGREFLEKSGFSDSLGKADRISIPEKEDKIKDPALEIRDVCFRYSKDEPDVLFNTSLTAAKGEILCVLGANGSGKSTLLYAISGLVRPYAGKIEIFGKNIKKYSGQSLYDNCVALLPQNAQSVFVKSTLREELAEVGAGFDIIPYDLSYAADIHPYDLSGGEMQLAALAKVLASKPRLLLLDEPTKGLDSQAKRTVCEVLKALKNQGITIISVTHDVKFAALCSDRAAMFFRGAVTAVDEPHRFFAENIFYTTSINRIASPFNPYIITLEDAEKCLGGA
ncbi:MAG: ATP-binding cassette domain-containing protein [Clostridia bacterium]|nr:ATP-binding cassette domain-containing protein [Clostridia bacterium]